MKSFRRLPQIKISLNIIFVLGLCGFLAYQAFAQKPQDQLRIANSLEKNQQYEQALVFYKKVYHSNKHNFSAIIGIKNCLIGLQRYDQLTAFLEKTVLNQSKNSPLFVELAEAYFMNDQQEKALATWRAHIENNKKTITSYRLVAMSMVRQRLFDQAIAVYEQAIIGIPGQQNLHVDISNLYRAQLNYKKASDHLLQYYLSRPKQFDYLQRQLLSISDKSVDISPVVNSINQFILSHPDQNKVREILAGLYVKNEEFDQAFEIYKNLGSVENNAGYVQKYALEAMSNEAYIYAIKGFDYILNTYPTSPLVSQVNFDLGRAYASLAYAASADRNSAQTMDKAVKIFKNIIFGNSKSNYALQSFIHLGDIYFDFYFDLDSAIDFYHRFLKKFPSNNKTRDKILIRLGDAYLTKNQVDPALNAYRQTKQKEYKILSRFKQAEIYFFNGDFNQAEKFLSQLLAVTNPNDLLMNDILSRWRLIKSFSDDSLSLARYAEAELLKFQKKYAQAAEEYVELSQEKNKLCSLAGREAAKLFLILNKYKESVNVLTTLRDKIPQDKDIDEIIYLLAISEEKLNNLKTSLSLYHELLTDYPNSLYIQEAREQARIINLKINEDQI